jgi:uncharacterized protein
MKYFSPVKNEEFVGREPYWRKLQEIDAQPAASIIVVYGRRRVGKTELIEQYFLGRNILKFEGRKPDRAVRRKSPKEQRRQLRECLTRLGEYLERPAEYAKIKITVWSDFYRLLLPHIEKGPVVLYLDEVQWLANYSDDLLSDLKPFWDDVLRHNAKLRIVITGSSPSFIVNQFLASSALYNRSNHMIRLTPFDIHETQQFLQKGPQETMLAAIAAGGIPEYLKQIKSSPSVFIGLCEKSFKPGGFFREEKDRVFVSSLQNNRYYEGVVDYLARHGGASQRTIYEYLSKQHDRSPGGSFSEVLDELVEIGFVDRLVPLTVKTRNPGRSRHAKYVLADEYLNFYYKFIEFRKADIDAGKFLDGPAAAINPLNFNQAMGFALERWCRRNERLIARYLRFGGVVDYLHGPWFMKDEAQVDLMFIRKDSKIIFCEAKYNAQTILDRKVIFDVSEKVQAFLAAIPRYQRYTVETALITMEPVSESLKNEGFFSYLITCDELLAMAAGRGPPL